MEEMSFPGRAKVQRHKQSGLLRIHRKEVEFDLWADGGQECDRDKAGQTENLQTTRGGALCVKLCWGLTQKEQGGNGGLQEKQWFPFLSLFAFAACYLQQWNELRFQKKTQNS
jgi:hypothetical protein